MRKRSKRHRSAIEKIGDVLPSCASEAVGLVKDVAGSKFTESVDIVVRLNIDTCKADQQVRGSFSLPHGTGKDVRVIAFVDDEIQASLDAGAVKAGGEDLVKEMRYAWTSTSLSPLRR